jgi:hypothetical protein
VTGDDENDWPERVPVTSAEVDVFGAWFGDILDRLFAQFKRSTARIDSP